MYVIRVFIFIILFIALVTYIDFIIVKRTESYILQYFLKYTNGYIKMDSNGRYEGDYYLSIENFHNSPQHIHIWIEYEYGIFIIKYMFKKYGNVHSNTYNFPLWNDHNDSTIEMIYKFEKFVST